MSEFQYCLNTSTIRPTASLEVGRNLVIPGLDRRVTGLAGEARSTAIEPWNDEITAYLERGRRPDRARVETVLEFAHGSLAPWQWSVLGSQWSVKTDRDR